MTTSATSGLKAFKPTKYELYEHFLVSKKKKKTRIKNENEKAHMTKKNKLKKKKRKIF